MAVRPSGLTTGGRESAAPLAAVLVVAAVVAALVVQGAAERRDRAADRDRASADVSRFETELRLAVATAGRVAAEATTGPDAFRVASRPVVDTGQARAVALLDRTGRVQSLVAIDSVLPIADGGTVAGVQRVIDAAITTGSPRLSPPVALNSGPAFLALAPAYAADAGLTAEARRKGALGAVAVLVPLADLRHPATGPDLWPGGRVRITGPGGPAVGPVVQHPVLTRPVVVEDQVWTVRVGRLEGGGSRAGWVVLLAGLVAAVIVSLSLRRQAERRRRAEDEAAARARHLELIARTSAALQESLDLGELLPAFCVNVADEFDLGSVRVLVADDTGRLVETFRTRSAPASTDEVTTELELRRGWRAVGRLVVTARHPLDEVDVQSLQALADLLAVAMSNADLYQRELQAVTRLSELDALKNAFLGTVSHELRTATTAVQGFGELLTDHWDALPEERRKELAARIKRQADSLRHLVDDLLDYARLEHHRLRVAPRELQLTELVRQLTESMSPLVSDHEVVLDVEGDVTAWADPIAVERILANLLSNAGKYAPPGSTVTVGVERVGDRARVRVADQGPGIPPEERRRVFVRFYRLSNAETVRTHGAGIGLSILHDFADRSHARVTIDDAPGGGALITVDFPIHPFDEDDVDDGDATLAGDRP